MCTDNIWIFWIFIFITFTLVFFEFSSVFYQILLHSFISNCLRLCSITFCWGFLTNIVFFSKRFSNCFNCILYLYLFSKIFYAFVSFLLMYSVFLSLYLINICFLWFFIYIARWYRCIFFFVSITFFISDPWIIIMVQCNWNILKIHVISSKVQTTTYCSCCSNFVIY